MRIGYLLQEGPDIRFPPYDGPATHVREVVGALRELGHQVRVVLRSEGRIWMSDDLDHYQVVEVGSLHQGPLRWMERAVRRVQFEFQLPYANLFESWRFALACCDVLRDCDLLFERLSWMGYGGGLAARRLGKPLVVEYNGDPLHDLEAKGIAPKGMQRRLSLALMRGAFARASKVIASGEGWATQLCDDWPVDPSSVTTIENGTGLTRLLQREDLRNWRESVPAGAPVKLVYLGGFYPWHGVDILLRAVQALTEDGMDLELQLIGDGHGWDAAQLQAHEAGLNGRASFPGRLEGGRYASLLADADIGLSPYCGWREFSGLKLYDYMAAGLAIIASGGSGQPRALVHGTSGWIVPACDEAALIEAIRCLASDAPLRRGLGRAARLEAERSHTWPVTARRIEQVFQDVLHHVS